MRFHTVSGMVLLASLSTAAIAAPAAEDSPAAAPATDITPAARQLIDQVGTAYGRLHSLDLEGNISFEIRISGSPDQKQKASFTSSFAAPNLFRHQVKDDVLLGSTGKKLYSFEAGRKVYTLADAPPDRVAAGGLPGDLERVLTMENPSLVLALSKSPADELTQHVDQIARVDDVNLDSVKCPTLKLAMADKTTLTAAFDPQTHLLRQATTDMTAALKQRRPDVTAASMTVDYTKVTPDAPRKSQEFAWSPPAGAIDADAAAAARPMDDTDATALQGKSAPAFELPKLSDGKTVSLASLKGHVIVLDFWATWCPPCRMSLPHLKEMYEAPNNKGVEFFAVDQAEEKADVDNFVKQTKLTVPVLLDRDGKTGSAYGASAIPETVVIGKDGKIAKVFVGFSDEEPAELQKAVDAAKGR